MNRALLLAALLLAGASSADAQTATPEPVSTPARPAAIEEPTVEDGGSDNGPSSETRLVWVETRIGSQVVLAEDFQRTFSSVTNTTTTGELICVNAGFPSDGSVLGRLLYEQTLAWSGQAARFAIHCVSSSGVTARVYEYRAEAPDDPDDPEDDNAYVVDPTPAPEPTSTPGIQFLGSNLAPAAPNFSVDTTPTPTPTPNLYSNTDSYPGTLVDQATPTPSPTPVEIVVD